MPPKPAVSEHFVHIQRLSVKRRNGKRIVSEITYFVYTGGSHFLLDLCFGVCSLPADVAPLKKRRYRSKGGGGSGAEAGSGEVDTGKSTDHEDASNANEASSSLRSNSTNGDTAAAGGTAEEELPSPIGETPSSGYDHSTKSARVFDDPNKPNPAGWGENPYEKAAELNRGVRSRANLDYNTPFN